MHYESSPFAIDEQQIDKIAHILKVPQARPGDVGFNDRIDVFSPYVEGDRAQVYQMWAISKFVEHPIALEALEAFNLAGESESKEKWTQLLEHISGVTAIALHLDTLLEKYGATQIDHSSLEAATMYDSLQKPGALETATLLHDIEKPAELAAGAGGFENSLDNPVLRDGALWRWLNERGVSGDIITAAQNTGRSDRFYSDLADYPVNMLDNALEQRKTLAQALGVTMEEVNAMTPQQRRRASIEQKGATAAIVGIADALAAQFKFQGITPERIDAVSAHYLTYKTDPESFVFFGQDWPEYYKEVRAYLIEQVPEYNRASFIAELDCLTANDIFNETVLPSVLGNSNPDATAALRY